MPIDGLPGGDFTGCVTKMRATMDDPEAFCAWKIHELTGKWPSEEAARAFIPPTTEAVQLSGIAPAANAPYPGALWEVTLIAYDATRPDGLLEIDGQPFIMSKNGRLYSVDALRTAGPTAFEGCKVYDNHLTEAEFQERGGMRSFQDELTGIIVGVRFDEAAIALQGVYKVGDRKYAQKLRDFYDLGILEQSAGFSIDTFPLWERRNYNGKSIEVAMGFKHVNSTDVVTEPAAGGGFNRNIAAIHHQTEANMEGTEFEALQERISALEAAIKQLSGAAEAEPGMAETPEEAAAAVAQAAIDATQQAADADTPEEAAAIVADAVDAASAEVSQAAQAMEAVRKLECQIKLDKAIAAAKLDAAHAALVRAPLAGRVFSDQALTASIKLAREAQAAVDPTGRATGGTERGAMHIHGTLSPEDKAAIGFAQLLASGTQHTSMRKIEANEADYVRERFPEWMQSWQNAGRPIYKPRSVSNWAYDMLHGSDPYNMPAREANDIASITKNTLNLFLAAEYSVKYEWWTPIVAQIDELDNIHDLTLLRVYGLGTLSVVEAGDPYTPLYVSDDEELGTYKKFGNYVPINIEDYLQDRLQVFQKIPRMLADSWYNTLSSLVSGVFTVNTAAGPVLSDTGTLFNATAATSTGGHANLGSTALSWDTYDAAITSMDKQTNQKLGAGQRLLIGSSARQFILGPSDLRAVAEQIRSTMAVPNTAENRVNPYGPESGDARPTFVAVPEFTDTNNWAVVADPLRFPAIYLPFVRGYRVPQVVTQGEGGAMFTNDQARLKIQLFTFKHKHSSTVYDCAPVADFRPLYKANV